MDPTLRRHTDAVGVQTRLAGGHQHRYTGPYCDCRIYIAAKERDCCCVGGNVCWEHPIMWCSCGSARDPAPNQRSTTMPEHAVDPRLTAREDGGGGRPDDSWLPVRAAAVNALAVAEAFMVELGRPAAADMLADLRYELEADTSPVE